MRVARCLDGLVACDGRDICTELEELCGRLCRYASGGCLSRFAFVQESGRWKVCDCKFPLKSGGLDWASVEALIRMQHFPEVF